jgi:hypothetical protein
VAIGQFLFKHGGYLPFVKFRYPAGSDYLDRLDRYFVPGRLAGRRFDHDRIHGAEDYIDAAGYPWHDGASGHGDKARHERILDEVLPSPVFPDLQVNYQPNHLEHRLNSAFK